MSRPDSIRCVDCNAEVPVGPVGRIPTRCEEHRRPQWREGQRAEDIARGVAQKREKRRNARVAEATADADDLVRLAIQLSLTPKPAEACLSVGLRTEDPDGTAARARELHPDLADPGDYTGLVRRTRAAFALGLHTLQRRIPEIAPGQLSNVLRSLSQALETFAESDSAPRYTEITLSIGDTRIE